MGESGNSDYRPDWIYDMTGGSVKKKMKEILGNGDIKEDLPVSDVEEVPAQEPAEEDVSEGSNAPTDPAASSDDDYWPYDMSDSLKKMKNEKAEAVSEDTAAAKSTTEGFSEKVIVAEENEEAVVSRESISAETENDTDKTDDSVKEKKKKKGIFHRMFSYDRE